MAALFVNKDLDEDNDSSSDDSEYVPDQAELDKAEIDDDEVDEADSLDDDGVADEAGEARGGGAKRRGAGCLTRPKFGRPSKLKSAKASGQQLVRVRRGGIRLEDEAEDEAPPASVQSSAEAACSEPDLATDAAAEREKRRADALWASFLADVRPARPAASSSVAKETSTVAKETCTVAKETNTVAKTTDSVAKATDTVAKTTGTVAKVTDAVAKVTDTVAKATDTVAKETNTVAKETITVAKEAKPVAKAAGDASRNVPQTKIFEFAGESVAVPVPSSTSGSAATGTKRPSCAAARPSGVASLLDRLTKRPKLSTLEKSRLDWESFKSDEGIGEDLAAHNRGKAGYLERQAFLERADYRRYELERDARLASSRGGGGVGKS